MDKITGDERMIDTDKYEGHDEDWKLGHSGVSPFVHILPDYGGELTIHATNDYLQEIDMGEANAQLIADAPKLLAEVKQIHEILREAFTNAPRHSAGDYLNMIARVTGLIE